jgi:hypothetical protein
MELSKFMLKLLSHEDSSPVRQTDFQEPEMAANRTVASSMKYFLLKVALRIDAGSHASNAITRQRNTKNQIGISR